MNGYNSYHTSICSSKEKLAIFKFLTVHVLLNLHVHCEVCEAFLLIFHSEFNKFINTGARVLVPIYHMIYHIQKLL